jgi:hypothetical protein
VFVNQSFWQELAASDPELSQDQLELELLLSEWVEWGSVKDCARGGAILE